MALAIVRQEKGAVGPIKVTVTSPGLKSASATLTTQ
jgi:hypothetical protein